MKDIEIEKKQSPSHLDHIKLESPVNLPKGRKKQKNLVFFEFEV